MRWNSAAPLQLAQATQFNPARNDARPSNVDLH
jgi:hypothetical protein